MEARGTVVTNISSAGRTNLKWAGKKRTPERKVIVSGVSYLFGIGGCDLKLTEKSTWVNSSPTRIPAFPVVSSGLSLYNVHNDTANKQIHTALRAKRYLFQVN
jgi:hypothetical protein